MNREFIWRHNGQKFPKSEKANRHPNLRSSNDFILSLQGWSKRGPHRHIIIKLTKVKGKERILKAAKVSCHIQGSFHKISAISQWKHYKPERNRVIYSKCWKEKKKPVNQEYYIQQNCSIRTRDKLNLSQISRS